MLKKSVVKCQLNKTMRLNKKAPMETTTANLPFKKCPFGHYWWYSDKKAVPTPQLDADAVTT
jgi:hypothetical protein